MRNQSRFEWFFGLGCLFQAILGLVFTVLTTWISLLCLKFSLVILGGQDTLQQFELQAPQLLQWFLALVFSEMIIPATFFIWLFSFIFTPPFFS